MMTITVILMGRNAGGSILAFLQISRGSAFAIRGLLSNTSRPLIEGLYEPGTV